MQIGCQMAFNDYTSPDYIKQAAQHVEEQGFHQFWVPEHVLFFPAYGLRNESNRTYSQYLRDGHDHK